MKTVLVVLAILISGSTYAAAGFLSGPTKNIGCYGIGKVPGDVLAQVKGIVNPTDGSGSSDFDIHQVK